MIVSHSVEYYADIKKYVLREPLAAQWLGLQASTSESLGLIPGQELRSHKPKCSKNLKKCMFLKIHV